jgi:PTS system nitrogen regulatory IIA component
MQMNARDAARFLGMTEGELERLARRQEIPAHRMEEQYWFNRVDLLEWAAARNVPVAAEMLADPHAAPAAELPSLADAVRAGGIHYGVAGGDKPAILAEVVALLPDVSSAERGLLHRFLLAREALGSTGIGHGVAIPHPRNPIVLRVARPMVALCLLERPVDFDALDGQPVHTVCALVSPSVRVHLHLLAVLSSALGRPAVRELLERRAPEAEILAALAEVDRDVARRRAERAQRGDA